MSEIPLLKQKGWPVVRRANSRSRSPWGYNRNPEDKFEWLPDPQLVMYAEKAMDFLDEGNSLRETANWLTINSGVEISHTALSTMWKRNRGDDKTSVKSKKIAIRKNTARGKSKIEKEEYDLARRKSSLARSETLLKRKEERLRALKGEDVRVAEQAEEGGATEVAAPPFVPVETFKAKDPLSGLSQDIVFRPNPGPQTDFLAANEMEVLYGGPLALDTRVVTPTGYARIDSLDIGDLVYTPLGQATPITDIPFRGVEESYRVTFADGTEVIASEGHKWRVTTADWRKTSMPMRTKYTKELLGFKLAKGRNKYFVPITEPVEFPTKPHILSPYFVGAMLGDGCVTKRCNMSLTGMDPEIVERIDRELPAGYSSKKSKGCIQWKFTKGQYGNAKDKSSVIWDEFCRLGLAGTRSHSKFIPSEYLYDSVGNRIALLRGLMDTDGTVRDPASRNNSELKYTTISSRLKDDFVFLAESLGYSVTCYEEMNPLVSAWKTYRILLSGTINPFHISRKVKRFEGFKPCHSPYKAIVSVEPVGKREVLCITIADADSLFLIDHFTVTHNSAGGGKSYALLADPMRYFHNKNFNGLILRRTNDELRELIWKSQEMYPRAFPGATWQEKKSQWSLPAGGKLWMSYLERDEDVFRYQGLSFNFLGWDELTQHATPFAYNYMRSRLRSIDPTLPLMVRATTNPGNIGHFWVKKMFIDPAPWGTPFVATDTETGDELRYPKGHAKEGKPLFYRRFIPARLSDNPYLSKDGNYEANLLSQSEMQRRQLLEGDWDISEGAAFSEFNRKTHVVEPFDIPHDWRRFRSCDFGIASYSAVHWYAIDPQYETLYVYRELYVSKHTARDLAKKVLELESGERIDYGVLDSSCWHVRGNTGPTLAEEMIAEGCRWRPADRSGGSRVNGRNRLHELLKVTKFADDKEVSGIVFFSSCRQIIKDMPAIPTDPHGGDDIDKRYASDHAYDSIRYGIQSRPRGQGFFDSFSKSPTPYTPFDKTFGY